MADNILYFTKSQKKRKQFYMDKDDMIKIEEIVESVLEGIYLGESPSIDIVALVKKKGFLVETKDMDIDTTGCLLVNEDEDERLIYVNTRFKNPDNESDVVFKKSRFITAHEFGHYILHREEGQSIYAHRDSYNREDKKEQEADYFARAVLMPLSNFKAAYEFMNNVSTDKKYIINTLSMLFKVTRNKVEKRIGDLAILSK